MINGAFLTLLKKCTHQLQGAALNHMEFANSGCDEVNTRKRLPVFIDPESPSAAIQNSGLSADMLIEESKDTY